jgi:hypothetical protein
MSDIFSPANTAKAVHDAIEKPDLPAEEVGIGFKATTSGDIGIQGHANKDVGKPGGWFFLAEGSWMRRAGGTVTGWLGWKPK